MADNANTGNAAAGSADEKKYFRSELSFPYADLESCVELAQTILSKAGTSCEQDELAAWMNQSATGGTFRTRISAAKMFGLIDTGQGRATLTQLGREAAEGSGSERAARVQAFLNPELFSKMYEQNKGHALPPPAAIERQMEQFGISPKQKERARQTFSKSATYAGFIDPSTGRFINPGNLGVPRDEGSGTQEREVDRGGSGGGDGSGGLELDPLLVALLKKVPTPDKGWPGPTRVRWFRTFAMNVSQIYDGDGEPVELKIELESKST
jgi:hypothetical protein